MKKINLILFLVLISFFGFSQTRNNVIMYTGNGSMVLMNVQEKKASTIGSVYLNEKWNPGVIDLYSETSVRNYPFKLDLRSFDIDINTENGIKVIQADDIKSFEWFNDGEREKFINTKELAGCNKDGFFKLIHQGKLSLFKYYELTIISSSYNVALDAGNQNNRYDTKGVYYVSNNGKFSKIKLRKRNFQKLFADKAEAINSFAKKNHLKYNNEEDLALIFEHYNSL